MSPLHFKRWFIKLCRFSSSDVSKVQKPHRSFRPLIESLEDRLVPATFTVTNINNGGINSLRWAITEANGTTGANTIDFDISGTGSKMINLISALPTISNAVTLDGTTETGFSASPLITLNGASAGTGANGLVVDGANANDCVIKGLVIEHFSGNGIVLESNGNTIQTCYIGTNSSGTSVDGNSANGILVEGTSTNNTIGGTTTVSRNLISGNTQDGILITGSGSTGNLVEGNYIGTNAAGTFALFNRLSGVELTHGATNNTVGGTAADNYNFIAGNSQYGISIKVDPISWTKKGHPLATPHPVVMTAILHT